MTLPSGVASPEPQRPDTWAKATLDVSVGRFRRRVAVMTMDFREADCPVGVGRARSGAGLQRPEGRPGRRRRAMLPSDPRGSVCSSSCPAPQPTALGL